MICNERIKKQRKQTAESLDVANPQSIKIMMKILLPHIKERRIWKNKQEEKSINNLVKSRKSSITYSNILSNKRKICMILFDRIFGCNKFPMIYHLYESLLKDILSKATIFRNNYESMMYSAITYNL